MNLMRLLLPLLHPKHLVLACLRRRFVNDAIPRCPAARRHNYPDLALQRPPSIRSEEFGL